MTEYQERLEFLRKHTEILAAQAPQHGVIDLTEPTPGSTGATDQEQELQRIFTECAQKIEAISLILETGNVAATAPATP